MNENQNSLATDLGILGIYYANTMKNLSGAFCTCWFQYFVKVVSMTLDRYKNHMIICMRYDKRIPDSIINICQETAKSHHCNKQLRPACKQQVSSVAINMAYAE